MLPIHIAAGLLSLAAGFVALFAAKGSPLHRTSGRVFVVAMLAMTSSAAFMATFTHQNRVNLVAAVLTFYLVCTALLAVRRPVDAVRGWLKGFMLVALVASAFAFALGIEALNSPRGIVDKVPAPPLFLFGVVGLLGAALDARVLRAGSIQGPRRIARHLWRMTFALWIATSSFFLGQSKFFPEPVRKSGLLAIPVVLVLALLVYWLVRTLRRRRSVA